jgi:hypothetical protein
MPSLPRRSRDRQPDLPQRIAAERDAVQQLDELIAEASDAWIKRALRSGAAQVQRRLDALLMEQAASDLRRDFKVHQLPAGDR